jgi:hypothetical protein
VAAEGFEVIGHCDGKQFFGVYWKGVTLLEESWGHSLLTIC